MCNCQLWTQVINNCWTFCVFLVITCSVLLPLTQIDPIRTISAGKVNIGAFRTYPKVSRCCLMFYSILYLKLQYILAAIIRRSNKSIRGSEKRKKLLSTFVCSIYQISIVKIWPSNKQKTTFHLMKYFLILRNVTKFW